MSKLTYTLEQQIDKASFNARYFANMPAYDLCGAVWHVIDKFRTEEAYLSARAAAHYAFCLIGR